MDTKLRNTFKIPHIELLQNLNTFVKFCSAICESLTRVFFVFLCSYRRGQGPGRGGGHTRVARQQAQAGAEAGGGGVREGGPQDAAEHASRPAHQQQVPPSRLPARVRPHAQPGSK